MYIHIHKYRICALSVMGNFWPVRFFWMAYLIKRKYQFLCSVTHLAMNDVSCGPCFFWVGGEQLPMPCFCTCKNVKVNVCALVILCIKLIQITSGREGVNNLWFHDYIKQNWKFILLWIFYFLLFCYIYHCLFFFLCLFYIYKMTYYWYN